jgi:hypothetical protein
MIHAWLDMVERKEPQEKISEAMSLIISSVPDDEMLAFLETYQWALQRAITLMQETDRG